MADLTGWLAAVPDDQTRAWLEAHPSAMPALEAFGDQGFDVCKGVISFTLPAACLARRCSCAPGAASSASG